MAEAQETVPRLPSRAWVRDKDVRPEAPRGRAEKSVKALPQIGAVYQQWVRCGRSSCRCGHGELPGPYAYLLWREGGRLGKRYPRLAEEPAVQAACAEGRASER